MTTPIVYDRVKETSTTTGTGTLTLAGAVSGFLAFSSVFSANDETFYYVENQAAAEWEIGRGTYSSSTLSRDVIYSSSNSNAAVSFSAGTKNVWVDAPASPLQSAFTAPRGNLLINAGFPFFQRGSGTLTLADDTYAGADRWYVLTQTASISSIATTTAAPAVSQRAIRLTQTQASAQRMGLAQIVENLDAIPMRGRTLRFQFMAKSSTSTLLRYALIEWTGTADSVTSDVVNDWTSSNYSLGNFYLGASLAAGTSGTTTLSSTYQMCACSKASINTNCNNLIVFLWTDGTAAQNVTVDVTDAQLIDATGTGGTFEAVWLPRPVQVELALCQRFYTKSFALNTAPAQSVATNAHNFGQAVAANVAVTYPTVPFPVRMRVAPTMTSYNPAAANVQARNTAAAADYSATTLASTDQGWTMTATGPAGGTAGQASTIQWTADAEL